MGGSYKNFCETMNRAAEQDGLPIIMRIDNTFGLSFQDVADLFHDFEKDTGLDITANVFLCDECNQLHMELLIDYAEEEDEDDRYLQ